jgi:hypothetical protein
MSSAFLGNQHFMPITRTLPCAHPVACAHLLCPTNPPGVSLSKNASILPFTPMEASAAAPSRLHPEGTNILLGALNGERPLARRFSIQPGRGGLRRKSSIYRRFEDPKNMSAQNERYLRAISKTSSACQKFHNPPAYAVWRQAWHFIVLLRCSVATQDFVWYADGVQTNRAVLHRPYHICR